MASKWQGLKRLLPFRQTLLEALVELLAEAALSVALLALAGGHAVVLAVAHAAVLAAVLAAAAALASVPAVVAAVSEDMVDTAAMVQCRSNRSCQFRKSTFHDLSLMTGNQSIKERLNLAQMSLSLFRNPDLMKPIPSPSPSLMLVPKPMLSL